MSSPALFTPKDFDPKRVLWGYEAFDRFGVDFGDRDRLGIDPQHPSYVVRASTMLHLDDRHTSYTVAEMEKAADATEVELSRLQAHRMRIPRRSAYIVGENPFATADDKPESGIAYIYTKRLVGDMVNPNYPEQTQHILNLGAAMLRYLAETPVGSNFIGDACMFRNHTFGRSYGSTQSPHTYLHDLDPYADIRCRPEILDTVDTSGASYETCLQDITETLGQLSCARQREVEEQRQLLIAQAELLYESST